MFSSPLLSFWRSLFAFGVGLAVLMAPAAAAAQRAVEEEILEQTAAVRELHPKQPVPLQVVDPAALRAELLQSYENEEAVRDVEISRKLLVMLGLLHPDSDLHGMLVDLYAENIAGYYSRLDKKMHVVSTRDTFGAEQKVTLAHEFTHALQDQYFDLETVSANTQENGDRSLAVQALIEGDATLTMVLYARTYLSPDELGELQSGGGNAGTLQNAPLVIRDEVAFPYNEGALFVLRLWQQGGYAVVNRAFVEPPRSTEQIIHPEKYLAGDEPIEITLPDLAAALGPDWRLLRSDVLGELDLRILLEQFGDVETASDGANGWGGDRFALLENRVGQQALVVETAWDNQSEAGEFFNAYSDTVLRRYGRRAQRIEDAPSRILWSTPNGGLLLQKRGARVAVIMAPTTDLTNTLLAALAGAPTPVRAPAQVPR